MAFTRLPKYGLVSTEMDRPMVRVLRTASDRASELYRYPVTSTALSTRLRVSSLTCRVPLSTCDTVEPATPATRATSAIVAMGLPQLSSSSTGAKQVRHRFRVPKICPDKRLRKRLSRG